MTHIGDRETNLYEEWATVLDTQTHLLSAGTPKSSLGGTRVIALGHLECPAL